MATPTTPSWHVAGDDVAQATCEGARLGLATVVEGIATGIIEIGAATPVVAPLCVALLKAKSIVDGASRHKDELEALRARCDMISAHVINKCNASKTCTIDVSPLAKCIQKLEEVAQRYHDQGTFARVAQFRRDGDDIRRLRDRIEAVVPIMGLQGVMNIAEGVADIKDQVEVVRQDVARLQPRGRLAAVPKGLPVSHWHTIRDGVVDKVYQILGGDGEPKVAALTGRSGAGKTTAAAAMVGERGPIRPRPGETEDEARIRLDRVRALFPDGVVALRVGKGEGAADRLPRLMQKLANTFHEDVIGKRVAAPGADEAGESFVKNIVLQESLRCLVVADDVWEEEVVEKLRNTGLWVLLTTRNASMVQPHESVVVDELTPTEAEDVLRGAAGLPPGERLCDAAMKVLEICGHVAMDIAFVGSWSSVRTANGVRKSCWAWADAVKCITDQIGDVSDEEMDEVDVNRFAVLRAGFEYLGAEDPLAQRLYVMLAVLPDGYSFGKSDVGILLGNEEVAMSAITVLERWAVLKAGASGLCNMHDAHVKFARERLMGWEDVRTLVVGRWSSYISCLEFAISIDVYTLLNMWHALERVGGEDLWVSRPYDKQLVLLDATERSKIYAVTVIAELYEHGQKFVELEQLMWSVLEQHDSRGEGSPGLKMTALVHISQSVAIQGRFQAQAKVTRQLREIVGRTIGLEFTDCDDDPAYASTVFNAHGFCEAADGFQNEAEMWFRKALKVQEDSGLGASSQAVFTLHELGKCVGGMMRWDEATEFLQQALRILEARLGPESLQVALVLHVLGAYARDARKPADAEVFFKRSLEIKEAMLGPNDTQTVLTLKELSHCAREIGRKRDADKMFLLAVLADLKQSRTWIQKDIRRGLQTFLVLLLYCCVRNWCRWWVGEPKTIIGRICSGFIVGGVSTGLSAFVTLWWCHVHGIEGFSLTKPFFCFRGGTVSMGNSGILRYIRGEEDIIFVNGVPVRRDAPPPFAALVLARVVMFRIPYTRVRIVDILLAVIPEYLVAVVEHGAFFFFVAYTLLLVGVIG